MPANPPNTSNTIAYPDTSNSAIAAITQGKKRSNTRCHSASRAGGSSGPLAGRSTISAKNMPPTHTTALTICRVSAIVAMATVKSPISTAIAGRLPRKTAKEVEHPPAPGEDRIVRRDELKIADRPRPLESPKYDVIGIGRRCTAEERLALDGPAQRVEASAERRQPGLAILNNLFEAHAEPRL